MLRINHDNCIYLTMMNVVFTSEKSYSIALGLWWRLSEQNIKAPRGDGSADTSGPLPGSIWLRIENKSGDYRGDWSRGVALTMADNATNPTRAIWSWPHQPPASPRCLQCSGRRMGPLMEPAVSSPFTWKAAGRKGRAAVWTLEDNVQSLKPRES